MLQKEQSSLNALEAVPETAPLKILFLTRSLNCGGAERQLVTLAKTLQKRGHDVSVAVMYSGGFFEKALRAEGVPVHNLSKRGRWETLGFVVRLLSIVRGVNPHILHSYIVVPNLLACLVKFFNLRIIVVWGLRGSFKDAQYYDWIASLVLRFEKWLSIVPALIIVNSQEGARWAEQRGVRHDKLLVIENGIDSHHFHPNASERYDLRREWGIAEHEHLVGLVGRLDPMKGHATFLRAAAKLSREREDVRFICVGGGQAEFGANLKALAEDLKIDKRVIWTGVRSDMRHVFNSLDVLCSASEFGEGFSNVISEAMACGIPCVVTDVGDSARIVGDFGLVVPPRNPDRLCEALARVLLDRDEFDPIAIRESVVSRFSVAQLVARTERALSQLRDS